LTVTHASDAAFERITQFLIQAHGNFNLLCHFDGTNGQTTTTDDVGHTLTIHGGATLSTAQFEVGTASLYLPQAGHGSGVYDYVSVTADANFNFGANDFHITAWVYATSVNSLNFVNAIFSTRNSYSDLGGCILMVLNGHLSFLAGTVGAWNIVTLSAGTPFPTGSWHYVEISRSASSFYLFMDGSIVATGTSALPIGAWSNNPGIGSDNGGVSVWQGYIDELQLTNGVAGNTSSYTPPTAAGIFASFTAPCRMGNLTLNDSEADGVLVSYTDSSGSNPDTCTTFTNNSGETLVGPIAMVLLGGASSSLEVTDGATTVTGVNEISVAPSGSVSVGGSGIANITTGSSRANWYQYPIDVPPVIASAYDDEFASETLNGKWVIIGIDGDTGRSASTDPYGSGYLVLDSPYTTTDRFFGVQQDTSEVGSSMWTLTAKFNMDGSTAPYNGAGVVIRDSLTGKGLWFGPINNAGNRGPMPWLDIQYFNSDLTYASEPFTAAESGGWFTGYLRINYDGSNLYFLYSSTGQFGGNASGSLVYQVSATAWLTSTVGAMGCALYPYGQYTRCVFDWFRLTTP
jgi:hypothetical protein